MTIPNTVCRYHFPSRKKFLLFFWSLFTLLSPLLDLYFCFGRILLYLCSICSNLSEPKLGFIAPKLRQQNVGNDHLNTFLV